MADTDIAVTSLTAEGGPGNIALDWGYTDAASPLPYLKMDHFEVWVATSNDRALATKATDTPDLNYTLPGLVGAETRYFWIRGVDYSGNLGDFNPLGATAGLAGTSRLVGSTDIDTVNASDIIGELIAAQIADAAITANKLATDAVTAVKIAAGAVETAKIALAAVTSALIANNAVQTANIAALAVTAAKVANATITAAQIANTTITAAQIVAATITGTQIANTTIAAGNIVANTITASQIASSTITTTQIAANTILAADIAAGTLTATEIAAGTITAAKIAAGTITATQIAASTITGSKIAAGTITASNIVAGTITATQIAAGTITATQIAAATITAANIVAGTITTKEMLIVDFTNLIPDGNMTTTTTWSTNSGYSMASPASWDGFKSQGNINGPSAATGGGGFVASSSSFSVNPGDELHLYGQAVHHNTTLASHYFVLMEYNAAGVRGSLGTLWANDSWSSIALREYSASYTVPAGTFLMRMEIWSGGAGNAAGANHMYGGFYVRRKNNANLIVDGSITAAKIVAGAIIAGKISAGAIDASSLMVNGVVITDKIFDNAVSNIYTGGSDAEIDANASTTYKTLATVSTVVVPANGAVHLTFTSSGEYGTFSTNQFQILRDATVVATFYGSVIDGGSGGAVAYRHQSSYVLLDSPSAGTYNYVVQVRSLSSGGASSNATRWRYSRAVASVFKK
ncbi:MAG: hypothetical protein ABIY37_01490 [Devosia sp.]